MLGAIAGDQDISSLLIPVANVTDTSTSPLLVAAITLSGWHGGFRMLPAILGQRFSDIDYVIKPAFFIPAHVPLVTSGIDEFAFAFILLCHLVLLHRNRL